MFLSGFYCAGTYTLPCGTADTEQVYGEVILLVTEIHLQWELKTKIEKEDTKRELLGNQTSLTESHCIRCLEPFKFLVNSRRQCLDCQLYTCKSCSRFNKKEQGWVCDPCHMARVLKIGTLEWYHENVRARFKRFGSAKVMRSLFKRLSGESGGSQHDLEDGYEEHSMDAADSQNYKGAQVSHDIMDMDEAVRESRLAEADMASVFHQILVEQRRELELGMTQRQDDLADNRTIPSRSISRLSHSSCGSGSAWGPRDSSSSYLPNLDDSEEEEEEEHCQSFPLYQSHLGSHTSQESLNSSHPQPQITDLNRRMSAIENLLNHLEQKVTSPFDQTSQPPLTPNSTSPLPQWEEVDLEEQQLRQKLHELTDNISDHSLSSDEDESSRPLSSQDIPAWRSHEMDAKPSRLPTRPTSRASSNISKVEEQQQLCETNHSTDSLERKRLPLEEGSKSGFRGSTALLVELEDQVAQAAANVQNAQSEVSYIENRIAALNAAGMPVDKRRRVNMISLKSSPD
ncbi:melanophilin isoform X3 [Xyrichtys novacula]|uniref:Melanophilin isoform X3 n=1 Tax=Xyrichtys novacula TaxID=13765 RepID=A0AAV1GXY7_XYRNO|nr:melanophilin isoform X3 [Xyrichtys novacula]